MQAPALQWIVVALLRCFDGLPTNQTTASSMPTTPISELFGPGKIRCKIANIKLDWPNDVVWTLHCNSHILKGSHGRNTSRNNTNKQHQKMLRNKENPKSFHSSCLKHTNQGRPPKILHIKYAHKYKIKVRDLHQPNCSPAFISFGVILYLLYYPRLTFRKRLIVNMFSLFRASRQTSVHSSSGKCSGSRNKGSEPRKFNEPQTYSSRWSPPPRAL